MTSVSHHLEVKPADWRRTARRLLPMLVLILAGVLGVAAVAMAQTV